MSGGPPRLDAAIVLAGGASSRFGADKLTAPFGDTGVLAHLLGTLADVVATVHVVGPEVAGGPVPATAAGLAAVPDAAVVAVLAGDQPLAARALPGLLAALGADDALDGALGVDADGRDQLLLGVHRADRLRAALGPAAAGTPMRRALSGLRLVRVAVGTAALDVDTPADLARALAARGS